MKLHFLPMKNAATFVRRNTIRLARGMRDVWLIIGVTVALLACIEMMFRAQRLGKREIADRSVSSSHSSMPPNPFEATEWGKAYMAEKDREEQLIWEPYLYIRNPTFAGKFISVDSVGHRVTPLPPTSATRPLRVFFLGGSTTFGWFQRNENTIPAEASSRLQSALGTKARVEPTNFGVPGRIFTQEIIELILQLREGARPDVVVFYDGINDVMATVQDGRAGIPQNESNRVEDFVRGRTLADEEPSGMTDDRKWAKHILQIVVSRLEFVRSIKAHARTAPSVTLISTDSAANSIVRMYAANARIVESLAKDYGFQPIYIWQPALLSTNKPLTRREKWLAGPAGSQPEIGRIRDVHVAVPRRIGDTMRPILGTRFIDDTNLFSDDSLDVYVDLFGHTYESANPRIVDSFMPQLSAAALRALH